MRALADKIDVPKSTFHRHYAQQNKRIKVIGHDFYETTAGAESLKQLMVATILVFGIKAGVGAETISLFFSLLTANQYLAISPSTIRLLKNEMRLNIEEYGDIQMLEVLKRRQNIELHMGGDETYEGDEIYLVLLDLTSNFIFEETLTDNRTHETWLKHVQGFLSKFSKNIKSFSSDGARALKKLSKSIGCDHFMDLFHGLQDLKQHFACKFHPKRQQLLKQIRDIRKNKKIVKKKAAAKIQKAEEDIVKVNQGQKLYQESMFDISTQSHPFKNNNQPQTSSELQTFLDDKLLQLRVMSNDLNIVQNKKKLLDRFGRRILGLSLINDKWHTWVADAAKEIDENIEAQTWAKTILLPYTYWEEQLRKSTRKPKLRAYYQEHVTIARKIFNDHPLTKVFMDEDWADWAYSMTIKYQRTTSAIEGRNAQLARNHYNTRGIRSTHSKSQTVLHNFWNKRSDTSTACRRLCGFDPPDLFQWIVKRTDTLPIPRRSKHKIAA